MQLHEALERIDEIRARIDRAETFRGYRSATAAFSGLLALVAAAWQTWHLPGPDAGAFVGLWVLVAAVSLTATATEIGWRAWRTSSSRERRLTRLAVEQFLPCLLAGGLVTAALVRVDSAAWLLPGLWSVIYGLGVFASCRLLPKATFWVAAWYLFAGAVCLVLARGAWAFAPWTMAGTFGVGQFLAALVLYLSLERRRG